MRNTELPINTEALKVSSEILRALCHPLRLKILEFIDQNDNISVNTIYNTLKLEQSITSQHLRIMRNAGIVSTRREGKFIYYQIEYTKVKNVMHHIHNYIEEEKALKDQNKKKVS